MSSEDWSQVKAAFAAATELPRRDRPDFLKAAYPPAIVERVFDLLEHHRDDTLELAEISDTNVPARVFEPGEIIARRFRIVRYLGSGGMGQVYEAWDGTLSNSLAIKTLHPTLAHDPDVLDRFRREIQISREVAHEGLCKVFDVVEHRRGSEDIPCLTMELLNGENLAAYIRNRRPLPPADALSLLRPIAAALTALHEHGIVHRDLKPSNVMMMTGRAVGPRVVVTDFGLAKPIVNGWKFFESSGAAVAGSPYFMAPELWDGIRPGIFSDVYAFGLIADEMVTKSTAFDTRSLFAFYYSKFIQSLIPPSHRSANLPAGWDRAILRCLDGAPSRRYESAMDFLADLESSIEASQIDPAAARSSYAAVKAAVRPRSLPTVAVLRFTDSSPHQDQECLRDGLAEEIIHLLSQVRSLRVIARASAFQFVAETLAIQEIAGKLNATHILTGSVRKTADRLRVTAQLVEAASGCNLWSHQFDSKIEHVFAIQEEVAVAIVELLKDLRVENHPPAILSQTSNMEAYNLYLRGLFEFNQQTERAIEAAASFFEHAAAASPRFAAAYIGLADCYCTQEWYGLRPTLEVMPRALECAERALDLNDSLANAHCTMALINARYQWAWDRADAEFKQTFALNPGLARAQFCYALDYLTPLGRLDEALGVVHCALELDPVSSILHTAVGGCLYRLRRYAVAEKSLRNTLAIYPDFYHAHWSMARVLEQLGMYEQAVDEYEAACRGKAESPMILAELSHCFGVMGNKTLAEVTARRLGEMRVKRWVSPLCDALIHLGLSQRAEALECLKAASDQRAGALVWLTSDPRLDGIRGEPEMRSILTRLGTCG